MGNPEAAEQAWRDQAACVDADPRIFTDPRPDSSDVRRAVDICQTCPAKQPCLETALRIEPAADVGIWGGTTPHARRRLRRERHQHTVHTDVRPLAQQQTVARPAAETERLHLVEDGNGDFVDRSGRVIVFEIYGDPPFMLMIDRRPRARIQTVDDAAGLAAHLLAKTAVADEVRAAQRAPSAAARRLA